MNPAKRAYLLVLAVGSLFLTGCVVSQPRGHGKLAHLKEPTTGRGYWLYLPQEYASASEEGRTTRRWPLVMTFHGMKPFDNAQPQALEWESEADRYGFIVVAPQLNAPDVLGQFPVRAVHPAFRDDEIASIAILDHVLGTTRADPANILSTSWSSGGYMAHYMLNRHPDRFTALAVRQSNFSSGVLDPDLTTRSQDHPILIVNTENDFSICRKESAEAVEWYSSHGYRNCAWVRLKGGGHVRTPDMAAYFFGMVSGVHPNEPPAIVMRRQAIDGNPEGLAFLEGKSPPMSHSAAARPPVAPNVPDLSGIYAHNQQPNGLTPTRDPLLVRSPAGRAANGPATPERTQFPVHIPQPPQVKIVVSSAIGIEPLHLEYRADCPADWHSGATFAWTLDGETIGDAINGAKAIPDAGEHSLTLAVRGPDGQEYHDSRLIRVIPRLTSSSYATHP